MLSHVTDINYSVWINASAGSGKTTLLVKRLLALLVQKQKNIVCITFTKAAASEMQNRLSAELGKLSFMEEDGICKYLEENLGYIGIFDSFYVKNLLYTVEKCVTINTFHSFCIELLQEGDLFYQNITIQE